MWKRTKSFSAIPLSTARILTPSAEPVRPCTVTKPAEFWEMPTIVAAIWWRRTMPSTALPLPVSFRRSARSFSLARFSKQWRVSCKLGSGACFEIIMHIFEEVDYACRLLWSLEFLLLLMYETYLVTARANIICGVFCLHSAASRGVTVWRYVCYDMAALSCVLYFYEMIFLECMI